MRNARLRVRWLRKMWRWKTVIQTSLDQGAWKLICPCPHHFANQSPKLSTLHLNLNQQWTPDIHSCVWVWSCSVRGFATQWESGVQQTSARADHIDIRFLKLVFCCRRREGHSGNFCGWFGKDRSLWLLLDIKHEPPSSAGRAQGF